jgi:probable addiction module antidote protein
MGRDIGSTAGKKVKRGSSSLRAARSGPRKRTSKQPRRIGRTSKKEAAPSVPYETDLFQDLLDPDYARAYLAECLKDDHPGTFFVALRNVIQARRIMAPLARRLHLNRPALYKALSENGNPSLKTIRAVLAELDFRLDLAD